MTPERMRDIFAECLEACGEPGLARAVRSGYDNSNGGAAALDAMKRVAEIAATGEEFKAGVATVIADNKDWDAGGSIAEAEAETVPVSDAPIEIKEITRVPSDHV